MHKSSGLAVVVAVLAVVMLPATAFSAAAPTSAPGAPSGVSASPGTLSATVRWTPSGAPAASYTVTSSPGGISATVDGTVTSATVTGLGFLVSYRFSVTGTNAIGTGPASALSNAVTPDPPGGPYHQGVAVAVLNSDINAGSPIATNLGNDPVHLPGLSAVVLNVTVSQATVATSVQLVVNQQILQTIWDAPGQVESSLAVLRVPATLTQSAVQVTAGRAHVEVDFVGYFTGPKTLRDHSGLLTMVTPATLMTGQVGAGSTTDFPVLGQGGIPAAHVAAVLLNVTATNPVGNGRFVLRPSGGFATGITTLGFAAGQTTANRAIVAVPTNGAISMVDSGAAAGVRIDVLGWFSDSTDVTAMGSLYSGVGPARLVDTAAQGGPLAAGASLSFAVWGQGGAPPATAVAPPTTALLQIVALAPAGAGSISVFGTSVIDFAAGQTVSGVDLVVLAGDGSASLTMVGAASNVTVDLVGYASGDLIIPGTTKKLPLSLLAGIVALTPNSITFASAVQASPPILVNDVINATISSTTPDGFLRRVLAITRDSAGQTVVSTRPATLSEALTAFSIDWVLPQNSTSRAFADRLNPLAAAPQTALPPFQPPSGTSIDPRWPSLPLYGNGHSLLFPVTVGGLQGEVDINDLELQLVPHISISGNPFTNVKFAAGLSAAVRFEADASLLGTVAGLSFTPIDKTQKFGFFIIPAGPIDIIGRPVLEFKFTVDVTLSGGIAASVNLDRYGLVTAGYDNGFFGNFKSVDYIPNGKAVSNLRLSVQAEFRAGIHLIPGVEFYGFATVGADLNPYFRFTVDPFATPWWTAALGRCSHIVMKIDLIILQRSGVIDLPCEEVQLAAAPGAKLNVTITPGPVAVARGQTQHFKATVGAPSAHGVTWSVLESGGGSLSNATVTDVDYMAPLRVGTYHVQAAAVDDPTSTGAAIVTVPAGAPSPPGGVTATPGPGSATVSWNAPADNGGVALTIYQVTVSPGGATFITSAGTTTVQATGLTPGASYTFTVTATNSAGLTSMPSAPSAAVTIPGAGQVVLQPSSVDFGVVALGQSSPAQTITVFADASVPLSVYTVTLGGLSPTSFAIQSDLCSGQTIAAGGSCTFAVLYAPTVQGPVTATVNVADNGAGSPQTVQLAGTTQFPVTSGLGGIFNTGVQFADATHGWIIDGNGSLATADGGRTWVRQQLNPAIIAIHFINPLHGWTVTGTGNVLATSNGGTTWASVSTISGFRGGGAAHIWFVDGSHGWLTGGSLPLYATTDGGVTWTQQTPPAPVVAGCAQQRPGFFTLRFGDALHGWTLGSLSCIDSTGAQISTTNFAWTTADGGATWTRHALPVGNVPLLPEVTDPLALHMRYVTQVPGTVQSVLVTTDDGGATFNTLPAPDNSLEVAFLDANHAVLLVNYYFTYLTSDGGLTWTPSPTSLLSALPPPLPPNQTVYVSITAPDANHWWVAGSIVYTSGGTFVGGGLVTATADAGSTWQVQLVGDGT